MRIFESDKFAPFMFVAISIALLLILFSFVSLFNDKDKSQIKGFTGFAISEDNETLIIKQPQSEELYSEKVYFMYYILVIILGICIFLLSFRFFLPWIKEHS